jgi:hypothetical protein
MNFLLQLLGSGDSPPYNPDPLRVPAREASAVTSPAGIGSVISGLLPLAGTVAGGMFGGPIGMALGGAAGRGLGSLLGGA